MHSDILCRDSTGRNAIKKMRARICGKLGEFEIKIGCFVV